MRAVVATPRHAAAEAAVARFGAEPAPLLPILHAVQEAEGWLAPTALAAIGHALRIELAELQGTVSSYHFFRLSPPDDATHWCTGPACRLAAIDRGDEAIRRNIVASRRGTATAHLSCPGRCESPVASFGPGGFWHGWGTDLARGAGRHPAISGPHLLRHVGHPDQADLGPALGRGAYAMLERHRADPEGVLAVLEASGLAGRGGAGSPAARKWRAVRDAPGDWRAVVVNADEGEPATFKDRVLCEWDPHLLIEGTAIGAAVVGARDAFIYLRYEYPEALGVLQRAIAEATDAGLLGNLRVWMRRGAGAYICGEETALLESLEGKKPFPRERPPYPVTHGLFAKPTLLSNVETLAAVPRILELGADAWKAAGTRGQPGTKLYSVSGDVQRPGTYELPFGATAAELVAAAGGSRPGRSVRAYTLGGISGGLLPAAVLDLPLDFKSPRAHGAMLGSGGIVVFDDSRCLVDAVRHMTAFFRDESCGKCFPCRIGTQRTLERLERLAAGRPAPADAAELAELDTLMSTSSACGLGVAAPGIVRGLRTHFADEVAAHAAGRCAAKTCHA